MKAGWERDQVPKPLFIDIDEHWRSKSEGGSYDEYPIDMLENFCTIISTRGSRRYVKSYSIRDWPSDMDFIMGWEWIINYA